MDNTVIVALIGLAGMTISALISAIVASKVTVVRIEQLEKKVEKHNNLIERTYKLEAEMKAVQHDISNIQKGA